MPYVYRPPVQSPINPPYKQACILKNGRNVSQNSSHLPDLADSKETSEGSNEVVSDISESVSSEENETNSRVNPEIVHQGAVERTSHDLEDLTIK